MQVLTLAILLVVVNGAYYCDTNLDGHFIKVDSNCNTNHTSYSYGSLTVWKSPSIIVDNVDASMTLGKK